MPLQGTILKQALGVAVIKEITGRAMGIMNTAGQRAGFLSPLTIGTLVQISGGGARSFDTAFMFLIDANLTNERIIPDCP
jgi:hypothetical protein